MKQSHHTGLRTWIELDRAAIEHNYKALRGLLSPKTFFMAVVKSNAYGHSLLDFSAEMEKLGADWFGVDSIVEGLALRKAGITKPILVLGLTLPEMLASAVAENISVTVSTFETLEAISRTDFSTSGGSGPLRIHVKTDTGMHRQGFQEVDMVKLMPVLDKLVRENKIVVEGLFTHFAAAKNPSFRTRTDKQLEIFGRFRTAFLDAGCKPIVHAAASGGAMIFPEAHFDMVRFGIAVYGLWPSREVEAYMSGTAPGKITLKPVLTWKTVVGEVKKVPRGERVGYDFTEELACDSVLAVCPIGYWHGFPRALSSVGHVLVRGRRARVIGRVSMDMITIDVTDVPEVLVFDEVVIIGAQGGGEITAERIADLSDTSSYEIVTRINPLIKRIVVEE